MPNRILVDTVFVIALINHRDQYHKQALELASRFEGYPLLITDAILLEIGNALARGYRKEAVAIIERFLASDGMEVVHLTPQLFERALAMYKRHQDKKWSLTDCISFVAMREAGVSQSLTFDRHFVQAGFEVLNDQT